MKKKVIFSIIVASILSISTVSATQSLSLKDLKSIKILWNGKELKSAENDKPAFQLDNRVYVPVYLLRQAELSVNLNKNTLSITDNKTKYISNLNILNNFRMSYFNTFEELEKEVFSLLGDISLDKDIDFTNLNRLLKEGEINANSFKSSELTIIIDNPVNISQSVSSIQHYKEAVNRLIKYNESGDKVDLEAFYTDRGKAVEAYEQSKVEFDNYVRLSLVKALEH